jgi:transcriptional regulator with XRE-family HTH domain
MPFNASKFRGKIEESGRSALNISKACGMPYSTISRLMQREVRLNPTVDTLDRVAFEIGCEVVDFLDPPTGIPNANVVDVCALSRRGRTRGEMLRWATNRRGLYILHTVITSNGRHLSWEETKRTINQILIRDRLDALEMLRTGRFATRLRPSGGGSANLVAPNKLMLELDDGTLASLIAAQPAVKRRTKTGSQCRSRVAGRSPF